ncbi:uncharacterized protein MONOS_14670 [Monocercomonoides exilis]|uniref:uncharacterized protein n=1 Tax=Monocercomonoides exilis TaxID=2049356 RepID=UPI00355A5D72|nr:hypothetical protein MONOS_14670 [Monocercomonoides exilis]|eukprot:MONOS_14670.1-p1 / transcript=MONOS_14670.1 / gene=MONOS_14670 / organism=Monocercomonoides_exilis_PA203 / gene_product=unspecified product / transcript_product=unspecified product / location=Mono_scaffold01045:15773-16248(-) / protein_length=123 / sequence_SO=supercontig / SO=protein_coding / is_pseudo=false
MSLLHLATSSNASTAAMVKQIREWEVTFSLTILTKMSSHSSNDRDRYNSCTPAATSITVRRSLSTSSITASDLCDVATADASNGSAECAVDDKDDNFCSFLSTFFSSLHLLNGKDKKEKIAK